MAGARGIRAGRAFVELGVSDKLTRGLKRAQARLKAFGAGVRNLGMRVTAVAGAALVPLVATLKVFSKVGDQLDKMSARTGVSVESLSELGFAAEQSGANLETLENGLRVMQRSINDAGRGLSTATEALSDLGLTFGELENLSPELQFKLIADRLARIEDPSKRAAVAMQVFGRSGTKLLPMLKDGAQGIEALQQQARELGLTISTQAAKDAALLTDTLNILWRTLKQAAFAIGAALAPLLIDLTNRVTRVVVVVTDWIMQNKVLIVTVAKIAAVAVAAGIGLVVLGTTALVAAAMLDGLASILAGIKFALVALVTGLGALLSPIGLVIGAVVALGTTAVVYTGAAGEALDWLKEQFGRLRDVVKKVMGGIADALAAGDITLAAQILWLSLKLAWQQGIDALNRVWLEAKRFFLSIVHGMWYGALAVAQQVWHALEVGWIETTSFMSRTWTNFTSDLKDAWSLFATGVQKAWVDISEAVGEIDSEQARAAKEILDDDLANEIRKIEGERDAALSEAERRRQSERAQASTLNEATLAEIGQQFEQAQQELDTATDAKLAETKVALAKARQQLDQAIAAAKSKRDEAEAEGGPPARKLGDPLAGLEDRLKGIGDVLAQKISVSGTFNPLAAFGLSVASPIERTARAAEATEKNTKRLADAVITGTLALAFT